MSILIDKIHPFDCAGNHWQRQAFHAKKMKEYGTKVVGGVSSPGKGGTDVDGIPVFNTMYDAVEQTKANTSIIFRSSTFCGRCYHGGQRTRASRVIVCIAEGIPTLDVIKGTSVCRTKGAMLIGPNCPGLISPGKKHGWHLTGTSLFRRKCRCHQP